jgi:hypothetical protein
MIDDLAPPRARILVGGLVVGALALRLGVMWLVAPSPPIADEAEYLYRSTSLAAGREVIGPEIRPPGSIWYYVAFHRLLDPGMDAVRLANVLAGVVGIALVYLLGSRLFDRRAGVVAAAVAAVYPNLVFYSVSAWNETLYVALTLGGLLLLTRRLPWAVAAAGLLWGLAALTREVGVLLLLVGAGWLARPTRDTRRWTSAAVFLAVFLATLLPWTIRLNRVDAPFALVARTTYLNLFLGNAPRDPEGTGDAGRPAGSVFRRQREYLSFGTTPAEREEVAKRLAIEAIEDRLPAWPFEKTVEMLPNLLTPNSLPAARLWARPDEDGWAGRWAYHLVTDGTAFPRDTLGRACVAAWIVVALAGVGGWVLAAGRPGWGLVAAFLAAHIVPTIIAFASSRFRIPLVPILIVGGAFLVGEGRRVWREASPRRRAFAAGSVALTAIIIASRWSTLSTPQFG